MEIFTLLENLEEVVESGSKVPFSSKVMVDIDVLRELIEDIRLKLPDELKQARWVKEERQRIIEDAQKEADKIKMNAESKMASMLDDNIITKKALAQKEEIIENANKVSKEICDGTHEYANAVLEKLEDVLRETLEVVQNNRRELN